MTSQAVALVLIGSGLGLLALIPVVRTPKRPRAAAPPDLLDDALTRLAVTPFDRMGPGERVAVVALLHRAAQVSGESRVRATIQVMLAEMALVDGDRELAAIHFRAALQWDPTLPVRRTIQKLDAPAQLLTSSRPGV
jgi:hypothetical protein